MSTDKKGLRLKITEEAAKNLHAPDTSGMKERAEAEEAKLQERRDKQAQQLAIRAKKKALQKAASDAEEALRQACRSYETSVDLKKQAVKMVERAEAKVAERKKDLDATIKVLERSNENHMKAVNALHVARSTLTKVKRPADPSVVQFQAQKATAAFETCNIAWRELPKSEEKKQRDRSLRKWAKSLLGL